MIDNNNQPKISIIVPVYNIENYISTCVQSICNQTYNNLEIFLVNDGSTDHSRKICEFFAKKDKRIKIIDKKNGGLSSARNIAIDKTTGNYILFVDGDDYIERDLVELLVADALSNQADIATFSFTQFSDEDNVVVASKHNNHFVLPKEKALSFLLYQKNVTTSAWGKLYKKELFNSIRYPEGAICEDLPVTYRLFSQANTICINTSGKYFYRQRVDSIIHSPFSEKRYNAIFFAIEETTYIKKHFPKLKNAAYNREFMEAIYILATMPYEKKYRKKIKFLDSIIRRTKSIVLFDPHASKLSKKYALISILGIKVLNKYLRKGRKI